MSTVSDSGVVDAVGTDCTTGAVHLTIMDHLDWDAQHLQLLQDKVNTYLAFIESGEICSTYPAARGQPLSIDVLLRHRPTETALAFLDKAKTVVESSGVTLTFGPALNKGTSVMPNPSIERTFQRPLRAFWPAAHVER